MRRFILLALTLALGLSACGPGHDVVLYCATDQTTAEEIIRMFERETGLKVKTRYDTEADKTVGLVQAIIQEKKNPRCDVFWNNEVVHTERLASLQCLKSYDSPSARNIPKQFRDQRNLYTGFAARARVLIVNTVEIPDAVDWPTSMWDLTDPRFKSMGTIAKPLTGTTLTHIASLFTTIGQKDTTNFLDSLKENEVGIAASNGATMRLVGEGEYAFGFTDTDDFNIALKEKGYPVAVVYPDQDGIGTFVIPNTVALIKFAPNPENAKKLIDFLLSEEVEAALAASRSAQIPVRDNVPRPEHVKSVASFKVAQWDVKSTANWMERFIRMLANREW